MLDMRSLACYSAVHGNTRQGMTTMNAQQVLAYVALKWPNAFNSPLAQAMHVASSMAQLEASNAERVMLLADARQHAEACLNACDGWTVETLGHNIQSSFGLDLSEDECDHIAAEVLSGRG